MNEFLAGFIFGIIFFTLWMKLGLKSLVIALIFVFVINTIGFSVSVNASTGVMSSFFFAVGVMSVWKVVQTYLARTWTVTEGYILLSVVEETGHRVAQFAVRLRCNYKVEGKTYACERVNFGPMVFLFRDEADKMVEQYREGTQVKVYFNPTQPKDSILDLRLPKRLIISPIIIFSCLAFLVHLFFTRA